MKSTHWLLVASLLVLGLTACAAAAPSEKPPRELPLLHSWSGTYPVAELGRLPTGQQQNANGYIGDAASFAAVWQAYMPGQPLPQIDFAQNLVLFSRNLRFFNRTSIVKVKLSAGVAEILAIATMSAQPIKDRLAMAMVDVPRQGIKAVRLKRTEILTIR